MTSSASGWRQFSFDLPPPLLLMVLYAVLIFGGAGLLLLPVAATVPVSLTDALFTSASAVTVTGLIVLDTGSDFTVFGQAVIALLIQLGGLGLMTFAVLVLSALGQQIGVAQQIILRDDLDRTSLRDILRLVRTILLVVLVCETVGAALMALVFVPEFGWAHGLWSAVFHSISAFNNAGFALYPDSLTAWADNPAINLTVPLLFIVGGLGYGVLYDIFNRKGWQNYSLHTKLMLSATGFLIVFGVAMFALLEWNNPGTLGKMETIAGKLWVSWFQGVTTRTAGFNTTDIGAMEESTTLMFLALMFIGGGSTSTAGGIKVTTAFILVLATIAFFKRRTELVAFGRSIGLDQVLKVMAITTIGMLFIFVGAFILMVTRPDGNFLNILFETVSAFGTVGLSRGETGELTEVGRLVIITIMFFGRVGPLTIGFFLATRIPPKVRYPEGQVYLG